MTQVQTEQCCATLQWFAVYLGFWVKVDIQPDKNFVSWSISQETRKEIQANLYKLRIGLAPKYITSFYQSLIQ